VGGGVSKEMIQLHGHWAAMGGHKDAVKLLLSRGANVTAVDQSGGTRYMRASSHWASACKAGMRDTSIPYHHPTRLLLVLSLQKVENVENSLPKY